ncbi:MAG: polyketide synthase, partial [Myxococcota bacterium]
MSGTRDDLHPDAIAIIGMACRFPSAASPEEFWQLLANGRQAITFFDDDELARDLIEPRELNNPAYVKARGVLSGIEDFDAALFDLSPREAAITDPQQRVFLECAWEALERCGYAPRSYDGAVGVFAGSGPNTYLINHLVPAGQLRGTLNTFQSFIHNKNDHLTTRVAYKLHLTGPAVTVQTACSTSLVAV